MKWFRMYGEFANDPKVQAMPENMQRRLVMLFCMQSNDDLDNATDDEILCLLRISKAEFKKTKQLFIDKGFINERWQLINWGKRQFESDSSTDRSKRCREKKKTVDATLQEQQKNVDATPPDTDTDTDTELSSSYNPSLPEKPDDDAAKVYQAWENGIGMINGTLKEFLDDASKTYSPVWVIEAIKEAVRYGANTFSYVDTVLRGWKIYGFKSDKPRAAPNKPKPKLKVVGEDYVDLRY